MCVIVSIGLGSGKDLFVNARVGPKTHLLLYILYVNIKSRQHQQ